MIRAERNRDQYQQLEIALESRIESEVEHQPDSSRYPVHILEDLHSVQASYYHTLAPAAVLPGILNSVPRHPLDEMDVFFTFPGISTSSLIIADAERRLEYARTLSDRAERRRQFFAAWYGYYQAVPFQESTHTIGHATFAGILFALTGDILPADLDFVSLISLSVGSQRHFIETLEPHF